MVITMIKQIKQWWISDVACGNDPDKICPHLENLKITTEGTLKVEARSTIECCKSQRVLKQISRLNK